MTTPSFIQRLRHGLVITGYLAAGALGLVFGWDFGNRLAGPWLGVITAINSALFCALLMSLAERAYFFGRVALSSHMTTKKTQTIKSK